MANTLLGRFQDLLAQSKLLKKLVFLWKVRVKQLNYLLKLVSLISYKRGQSLLNHRRAYGQRPTRKLLNEPATKQSRQKRMATQFVIDRAQYIVRPSDPH